MARQGASGGYLTRPSDQVESPVFQTSALMSSWPTRLDMVVDDGNRCFAVFTAELDPRGAELYECVAATRLEPEVVDPMSASTASANRFTSSAGRNRAIIVPSIGLIRPAG